MRAFFRYFYKDKVFTIAFIFAVVSMFIITPSPLYLGYINYKVLIIMFTLMIAVAGFYETHFFDYVATKLVIHFRSIKWIGLVIILTTFFLAMLLTNDAVLLTLVPFAIFITKHTKTEKYAVIIIILQTIAANMGSALTPMGDPQNIYLYAYYDIPFQTFLLVTLPITVMGFILVSTTALIRIPRISCELNIVAPVVNWKKLILYALILINALLSVLRIVPEFYTLGVTLILVMIYGRHLLKRVDYTLLLTFLSFFIFTGNLGQMDFIKNSIEGFLDSRLSVFFTALISSQLISNVPAAVLLSTFTKAEFYKPLLQGVNIGAMGTIIGSLASLITFKYILREYPKETKNYLLNYTVLSIIFIIIISIVTLSLP
ncbi:MAG: SLC13 family permease, partial [Acholeplasmataceae bacterium]|nr:SLC13 family permease [Acholeplasmataceae bacterium]